jgi:uncharacterized protein YkwD
LLLPIVGILVLLLLACSITVNMPGASPVNTVVVEVDSRSDSGSAVPVIGSPAANPESAPSTPDVINQQGDPLPGQDGQTFTQLEQSMLNLINEDRQKHGVQPVDWDHMAADVGRLHAIEMADLNYISHWNILGQGPDIRYGLAGGTGVVTENIYALSSRWESGGAANITDWAGTIQEAESYLMESPGHRANILDPNHTHVGVGIAYNPATGELRLAQEFLNQHIAIRQPSIAPISAQPGDVISAEGVLLIPAPESVLNLAYEPWPEPMSLERLRETSTYTSPAEVIQATPPIDTRSDLLEGQVQIPANAQPGIYHLRLWVGVAGDYRSAGNVLILVGEH